MASAHCSRRTSNEWCSPRASHALAARLGERLTCPDHLGCLHSMVIEFPPTTTSSVGRPRMHQTHRPLPWCSAGGYLHIGLSKVDPAIENKPRGAAESCTTYTLKGSGVARECISIHLLRIYGLSGVQCPHIGVAVIRRVKHQVDCRARDGDIANPSDWSQVVAVVLARSTNNESGRVCAVRLAYFKSNIMPSVAEILARCQLKLTPRSHAVCFYP